VTQSERRNAIKSLGATCEAIAGGRFEGATRRQRVTLHWCEVVALALPYIPAHVDNMSHISIRDLQKISGETIGTLAGPTPVKSGDRTVGLLLPLKAADPDRLAAVLARAEALARGRDPAADDAALAPFGEVDPIDWSVEAVRALTSATD
jgi:hypothetical protein